MNRDRDTDAYDEGATEGPYDESPTEKAYDDTLFPYAGSLFPFGWSSRRGVSDADETERYGDGDDVMAAEATENDSRWEEGLISTILVVGVVLFVIPEPATSGIGLALIAVGLFMALIDWLA